MLAIILVIVVGAVWRSCGPGLDRLGCGEKSLCNGGQLLRNHLCDVRALLPDEFARSIVIVCTIHFHLIAVRTARENKHHPNT